MSSRGDYIRRDRSWERDDSTRYGGSSRGGRSRGGGYRDEPRRRSSRSRSPRRDRDGDRRGDRRDKDYRRDDRRDDRRSDRDRDRERDRRTDERPRDRDNDRRDPSRRDEKEREGDSRADKSVREPENKDTVPPPREAPSGRPNLDPDAPDHAGESEEPMDAENDDDAAMMALMGVTGFGSTKGKHVTGNQEGAVNIKKQRTWRQYMNRRGGFNRPLDKIK
ncbi:DUF1777-domain-containing protein [Agrocybe pediades]|nr:DUF1777-domain-containing protein [Agrocybe pediades]